MSTGGQHKRHEFRIRHEHIVRWLHEHTKMWSAAPKENRPHLEREQQANGLQALLATIDIVAKKQVVGLGRESAIFKEPQQIRILPVNVACDI